MFELAEGLGYVSGATLAELRVVRTHCARLVTALARSISSSRHASSPNAPSGNRQRPTR